MDFSCSQCGGQRSLEKEHFYGQDMFICTECGLIEGASDDQLKQPDNDAGIFNYAGEGAVPSGYKYEKKHLSKARNKGIDSVQRLCQNFGVPVCLKKEILKLFQKFQGRNLNVGAGAVFLAVVRNDETIKDKGELITMRQVASFLDVPLGKLSTALKSAQKLLNQQVTNLSVCGAMTNIPGLIRSIMVECRLLDPFTGSDITPRIFQTTEKIIQLMQNHSKQHWEPNFTTMAACCLAWQSSFFYQSAYLGHLPAEQLKKPGQMSSVREFLALAKLPNNESVVLSVSRYLLRLSRELMQLLKKMTWIQLPAKNLNEKKIVPQYLAQILEFQEITCEVLSKEEEIKRKAEIQPPLIPPKVLSKSEEAALNFPELSERDLPEEDLYKYIRTPAEVKAVKALKQSLESAAQKHFENGSNQAAKL